MTGHSNHIGAWVPDDSDLPARLDARYESRSRAIVEACELLLAVDGALDRDPELSFGSAQDKRAYLRQLIYDDIREHRD